MMFHDEEGTDCSAALCPKNSIQLLLEDRRVSLRF